LGICFFGEVLLSLQKKPMIDFPIFSFIMMFGFVAFMIVGSVFKWGYDKEQKGERTDFLGRPNNHPEKEEEEMD